MINTQAKGLFNGMVSASLMFAPATHIEPAYAQVLFLYINKKCAEKKTSAEKRAFEFVQSTSELRDFFHDLWRRMRPRPTRPRLR